MSDSTSLPDRPSPAHTRPSIVTWPDHRSRFPGPSRNGFRLRRQTRPTDVEAQSTCNDLSGEVLVSNETATTQKSEESTMAKIAVEGPRVAIEFYAELEKTYTADENDPYLFVAWDTDNSHLATAMCIPIRKQAITNEVEIFQTARNEYYKKRGYWRKIFFETRAMHARISPVGIPSGGCFSASTTSTESTAARIDNLSNIITSKRDSFDFEEDPCHEEVVSYSPTKIGWHHSDSCPTMCNPIFDCPLEQLENLETALSELKKVPLLLEISFGNPDLAIGQNLFKRHSVWFQNVVLYHRWEFPTIGLGQHLSDIPFDALFIKETPKRFRLIVTASLVAVAIVMLGKHWVGSWEVGLAGGSLYVALLTLWVMCES